MTTEELTEKEAPIKMSDMINKLYGFNSSAQRKKFYVDFIFSLGGEAKMKYKFDGKKRDIMVNTNTPVNVLKEIAFVLLRDKVDYSV